MTTGAIILSILLGLAVFLWWNSRPAQWTPGEVADLLQALLNDRFDDKVWDYFVSVRIDDPNLDAIREQMIGVWVEGSDYMEPGQISPSRLNAKGKEKVAELVRQCGKLEREARDT